eukprot:Ihof_evm7s61 gene=Ihof_evmTU7s61
MSTLTLLAAALLLSLQCITPCKADWSDATTSAGMLGSVGQAVAFGDFNADRRTDLFMLETKTKVSVRLATGQTFLSPSVSCDIKQIAETAETINVVASDFNFDGYLDVLVTYRDVNPGVGMALCIGDTHTLSLPKVVGRLLDQGLVMHYNGDNYPDIFGEDPAGRRGAYVRDDTGVYKFEVWPNTGPLAPFTKPHSNAFVDLNGDCLSDLFVTTNKDGKLQGEIWINNNGNWSLAANTVSFGDLSPSELGVMTFADMDADGDMDIVVGQCQEDKNLCTNSKVLILPNRGKQTKESCVPHEGFGFDIKEAVSVTDSLGDMNFVHPTVRRGPITLHIGDYDFDGYPDVLAVMATTTSSAKVALLRNVRCDERKNCVSRGLALVEDHIISLVENPQTAAFFDYKEDVFLDILVITNPGQDSDPANQQLAILENSFVTDAFFVKVMVLNGKCISWCSEGGKFPEPEPIGVNAIGPSVQLMFDDVHGNRVVRYGQQFTQSSYDALQTPYMILGLGRTNNYIDFAEITVPYTLNRKRNSHTYMSVIPNAQLVIIPNVPQTPD